MSITSDSTPSIGDHLLLAGHVLQALETGRMRMHASDYREISGWVSDEFMAVDTETLRRLQGTAPRPLRQIVENVLYIRADRQWTDSSADHSSAESECSRFLTQLRTAS